MTIYVSAVLAGLLTSLSPCVIGALPFVVNSSLTKGRTAPIVLVVGLITSFISIGIIFTLTNRFLGLNQEQLRMVSAVLFILIGLSLIIEKITKKTAQLGSKISNWANQYANKADQKGLFGQFIIGSLLGFIWAPCSGPTLGYALTLVAKEGAILKAITIMGTFGIFAALPLLVIAYVSKQFFTRRMSSVQTMQDRAKKVMGIFLILFGIATLTHFDRKLEAFILNNSPEFFIDIITKY